jgi:uncharacterized ubiquitin-like protein YukD
MSICKLYISFQVLNMYFTFYETVIKIILKIIEILTLRLQTVKRTIIKKKNNGKLLSCKS